MKYRVQPGSGKSSFQLNDISPLYSCHIDASFHRGHMGIGVYFDSSVECPKTHSVRVGRLGKDSTDAELHGLYFAMQYALSKNIVSLQVFTDSSMAIEHLTKLKSSYPIVSQIHDLLPKFHAFAFSWIARERNIAANYLARYALQLPSSLPDRFSFLRHPHDIISFDIN